MQTWSTRPLEEVYAAIGVTFTGKKNLLRLWAAPAERARSSG
jgi:hypothetical protein